MDVYLLSHFLPDALHDRLDAEQKKQQLNLNKAVFIFGGFETFHKGHSTLLSKEIKEKYPDYEFVIVPVINPSALPKNEEKNFLQLSARIQYFANAGFTKAILWDIKEVESWSGRNFILKITNLAKEFQIIVGEDIQLGRLGAYKAHNIAEDFANVHIMPLVRVNNSAISTRVLKEQLSYGNLEFINSFQDTPYLLNVKVESDGTIQYPEDVIKMHNGIYAAFLVMNNRAYPALLHLAFDGTTKIIPLPKNTVIKEDVYFIEVVKEIRKIIADHKSAITDEDRLLMHYYFSSRK